MTRGKDSPLEKARSIFDFITLNMKYTFMPAYFGLENIAENCARSFTGDCGVFALLFITLCRCAGIPAQWQSGLAAEPYDNQLGELETADRGLTYGEFERTKEVLLCEEL